MKTTWSMLTDACTLVFLCVDMFGKTKERYPTNRVSALARRTTHDNGFLMQKREKHSLTLASLFVAFERLQNMKPNPSAAIEGTTRRTNAKPICIG